MSKSLNIVCFQTVNIFAVINPNCHCMVQNKNINYIRVFSAYTRLPTNSTQECIPVGCVPSTAVAVSPATHVPPPYPRTAMHVPLLPCVPPSCHTGPYACPPMWTEFLTHACENITFPQLLLRTVKSNE